MFALVYGRGIIKYHHYMGALAKKHVKNLLRNAFCQYLKTQNSALARETMDNVGCQLFKTPTRLTDLNPIENIFSSIK